MIKQYEMNIRISKFATAKNWRDIPTAGFDRMELVSLGDDPAMLYVTDAEEWVFPLNRGFQIYVCNEFLRAVTVGIDVRFESFEQYFELIDACCQNLKENQKKPIFDYSELKARIVGKFGTTERLAAELKMTADALNGKLAQKSEFDLDDIGRLADALEIELSDISLFFFNEVA